MEEVLDESRSAYSPLHCRGDRVAPLLANDPGEDISQVVGQESGNQVTKPKMRTEVSCRQYVVNQCDTQELPIKQLSLNSLNLTISHPKGCYL